MRDILAFGSIVIDNVIIVKRFASENETVQAKSYRYSFGGAGANVAVAASRLGTLSGIFAVSGYDFRRMGYRNYLLNQGVDISGVIGNHGFPMPRSFILTKDGTGDQILYYYENKGKTARLLFENEHLALRLSRSYRVIHFSTGHFEFYYDLLRKSRLNDERLISFDPGQEIFTYAYRGRRLLRFCHLLFMNKYEAKRLKEVLRVKSIKEIRGPKLICVSFGSVGCQSRFFYF
jgi:sugar/nucleoside kinase (ribokinase family)